MVFSRLLINNDLLLIFLPCLGIINCTSSANYVLQAQAIEKCAIRMLRSAASNNCEGTKLNASQHTSAKPQQEVLENQHESEIAITKGDSQSSPVHKINIVLQFCFYRNYCKSQQSDRIKFPWKTFCCNPFGWQAKASDRWWSHHDWRSTSCWCGGCYSCWKGSSPWLKRFHLDRTTSPSPWLSESRSHCGWKVSHTHQNCF